MAKLLKEKRYSEAELIKMFGLKRSVGNAKNPLMKEWITASTTLNAAEQYIFDDICTDIEDKIAGWNEESLKMNFIAFVLRLGHMKPTNMYSTFFEQTIESTVNEYYLKIKTDFMIATGILEIPDLPFFHFQEYKKQKDPSGDPTAQLLEAMLIAREINPAKKPIYGCCIVGKFWDFVILDNTNFIISQSYDCTQKEDLMQIIAILRKFIEILETRLLPSLNNHTT